MIGLHIRSLLRKTSGVVPVAASSMKNLHSNAKISASPRVALNDVVPRIRVEGLAPKMAVTIRAEMFDDKGKQLLSHAHFVSTEYGTIDVTTCPSVGGCYEGIFPTGIISTLKSADDSFEYGRVVHDDVEKPLEIKITLHEGHEPLNTMVPSLDHVTLERYFMNPGVKRTQVRSGRIRGILYIPAGDGIFPGVVEMYGATGILIEKRAALLASRGIACLCLAYFNYEDIPMLKLSHLDIEYFEEATEYLTSQPQVIPDRCGVVANCYGGVIAHAMAIYIDKVKAVYGINFGQRNFGVFTRRGQSMFYNDEEVPDIIEAEYLVDYKEGSNEITVPNEMFLNYMCTTKGSYIDQLHKVSKEKYFSYAFGEDDTYPFLNSMVAINKAVGKDFETNFEIKSYPLAGHIIDPPYTATVFTSMLRFLSRTSDTNYKHIIHYWGGKHKETVAMQEDVWKNLQKFVNYHIRDNSPSYQKWLNNPEGHQSSNNIIKSNL